VGLFRPSSDRCGQYEHVRQGPTWGAAWKSFIKQNADRWNTAYLAENHPSPTKTTISISIPTERDALGFPVIRITADNKDNEKRIGAFIQDKMAQWFLEAARSASKKARPARWAPRPTPMAAPAWATIGETNVVDRFGFSHEVPNLGILGASVMGTSGAHNPTLTAQALAWRTAEHLTKNWKAIAGG